MDFRKCLLFCATAALTPTVAAQAPCPPTPESLLRTSRCELLELYRCGHPAAVPTGFVRGWAIFKPGRWTTVPRAHFTHLLWQGKEFTCDGGTMINHVAGLKVVKANVFTDTSWFDGKPTLVFDYCGASKLFGNVRDEVREVAPGVYLGLTYLRKKDGPELAVFFVLDARDQ